MRKVLIILCLVFTFSLISCGKQDPTGTWYFKEAVTKTGETETTIKIGDTIEGFETIDFVFKDDTGEIKVTYYYGEYAKDLKAGDKFLYSGTFIKTNNEVICVGGLLEKREEIPDYYQVNKVNDIKEKYQNYKEGEQHQYVLFGEIKEITRELSGPKYDKNFAVITLNSDGTGVMKSLVPDFTGLLGDQNLEYNLTWVQINDTIKITLMGETQVAKIEDGCLILEEKGNQYGVEYESTTIFTRS